MDWTFAHGEVVTIPSSRYEHFYFTFLLWRKLRKKIEQKGERMNSKVVLCICMYLISLLRMPHSLWLTCKFLCNLKKMGDIAVCKCA